MQGCSQPEFGVLIGTVLSSVLCAGTHKICLPRFTLFNKILSFIGYTAPPVEAEPLLFLNLYKRVYIMAHEVLGEIGISLDSDDEGQDEQKEDGRAEYGAQPLDNDRCVLSPTLIAVLKERLVDEGENLIAHANKVCRLLNQVINREAPSETVGGVPQRASIKVLQKLPAYQQFEGLQKVLEALVDPHADKKTEFQAFQAKMHASPPLFREASQQREFDQARNELLSACGLAVGLGELTDLYALFKRIETARLKIEALPLLSGEGRPALIEDCAGIGRLVEILKAERREEIEKAKKEGAAVPLYGFIENQNSRSTVRVQADYLAQTLEAVLEPDKLERIKRAYLDDFLKRGPYRQDKNWDAYRQLTKDTLIPALEKRILLGPRNPGSDRGNYRNTQPEYAQPDPQSIDIRVDTYKRSINTSYPNTGPAFLAFVETLSAALRAVYYIEEAPADAGSADEKTPLGSQVIAKGKAKHARRQRCALSEMLEGMAKKKGLEEKTKVLDEYVQASSHVRARHPLLLGVGTFVLSLISIVLLFTLQALINDTIGHWHSIGSMLDSIKTGIMLIGSTVHSPIPDAGVTLFSCLNSIVGLAALLVGPWCVGGIINYLGDEYDKPDLALEQANVIAAAREFIRAREEVVEAPSVAPRVDPSAAECSLVVKVNGPAVDMVERPEVKGVLGEVPGADPKRGELPPGNLLANSMQNLLDGARPTSGAKADLISLTSP
jgi:hypothetical protein